MLPGDSLEPRPNLPDFAAIFVFHGTAGSIITIGFITERMLALENQFDERKQNWLLQKASKSWRNSDRASFFPPQ